MGFKRSKGRLVVHYDEKIPITEEVMVSPSGRPEQCQ